MPTLVYSEDSAELQVQWETKIAKEGSAGTLVGMSCGWSCGHAQKKTSSNESKKPFLLKVPICILDCC